MSPSDDRIPVPTNGHHPPLDEAAIEAGVDAGVDDMEDPRGDRPDLRIALTPAQAAVGFGVVASLVLLVLGARRRRR